jgi:transposase
VADAAYDSNEIRIYNRKRGIKSNIAINKRNKKKQKPGRPKKFDQEVYKKRSAVERFFSWIEGFRKIFPRYEVLEESYLGLARLSCILIIWRVLG